jgi:hypothetical protein
METNLSPSMLLASNLCPWKTHDWIGRRLEPVDGDPLILQVCRECSRGFVEECSTGDQYAVHVSIFKLYRLSDEVTSRWLSEKCPAECLLADDADRRTRSLEGPFGSAPGEMATAVFRSVTKSMSPLVAACSIAAITKSSHRRGRQRSGAASSKSILISKAQLVARTPPRDIAGEVRARSTPA